MQTVKKLIAALVILLPLHSLSQSKLTTLYPTIFFTETEVRGHNLTINGAKLWPVYMTLEEVVKKVKIYFKNTDKTVEMEKSSIGGDKTVVSFSSADWLYESGPIEVYAIVDGVKTNSLWLPVKQAPSLPPVIKEIYPDKIKTGQTGEYYYSIKITADNLVNDESNTVSIGDQPAYTISTTEDREIINVWVPKAYINTPGTYNVQIKTKLGISNTLPLVIEKPPLRMTRISSPVNISQVNTISTNNTVAVPQTVNIAANSGILYTANSRPTELLAEGIMVTMNGNIAYGEDGAVLEKFINGLDKVLMVSNLFKTGDNNSNIFIVLKGNKIAVPDLEKIKKTIEDKLKEIGLTNAGVVIK